MITNKNGIEGQFRQGDVLVFKIQVDTSKLVETKKCTLALGEVTGHHHTIKKGAKGFASNNKVTEAEYFEVEQALALLDHQEHETIKIPKGLYEKRIAVEYNPLKLKRVVD